jgi:hypothetical protein
MSHTAIAAAAAAMNATAPPVRTLLSTVIHVDTYERSALFGKFA